MNRIYRLVFNKSLGLTQVASELGSTERKRRDRRKSGKSRKILPAKTPIATAIALSLGLMAPLLWTAPAEATVSIGLVTGAAGGAGGNSTATAPGAGGTGTSTVYANAGGLGGTEVTNYGGDAGGPGGHGYGAGGHGGTAGSILLNGAPAYYYGGGGGGGGAVGYTYGGNVIVGAGGVLAGGAGGKGGNAYVNLGSGEGGTGGGGGIGLYGAGFTLTNSGSITGGAGGAGGSGDFSNWFGDGGAGGTGVFGNTMTVTNSGSITGGAGSAGTVTGANYVGTPGAGLVATGNSTISNSGTIAGGTGPSQADAVDFSAGGNTLKLYAGSSFTGNVISSSGATGNDGLVLGGTTNATLNGTFATTNPGSYGSAPVFAGFQTLLKSGASTWTITTTTGTTTNGIPNWDVEGGILQLASGDNFNPASTDTLTVAVASTSSTTATAGIDNGELNVPGTATLNGETLTVNASTGTYVKGTQYDLVHAAGITGKFGTVNYSGSFGSSLTPKINYTTTDVYMTLNKPSSGGGAFGFLSLFGLLGLAGLGRGVNRKNRSGASQ